MVVALQNHELQLTEEAHIMRTLPEMGRTRAFKDNSDPA